MFGRKKISEEKARMLRKVYQSETAKWRGVLSVMISLKDECIGYATDKGELLVVYFSIMEDGRQREDFYYRPAGGPKEMRHVFFTAYYGIMSRMDDEDLYFGLPKEFRAVLNLYRSGTERQRMGLIAPSDNDHMVFFK